tara:strand:+ start:230 stop:523 length:294 start_codon:yes stop_codon:yes gene_type:complete
MEENNKLIAEFMGAEKTHIKSVGDIYCPVPSKNGSEYADKLQYHKSWDWLMPVIHKCFDVAEDGQMSDIMHHLQVAEMGDTYDAVVEFIKDYNNGKN